MKRWGKLETILAVVVVVSLFMLFLENSSAITGHASEGSTVSNVTITRFLSIDFSDGIQEGIQFGNVTELPATDINASHNYDGASSGSQYYINVSTDSNTAVDFCIRASSPLTNPGTATIPLENETYYVVNYTNATDPNVLSQVPLTLSYYKPTTASGVDIGNSTYWRFWLDVPVAQETGTYNNTIMFKGVAESVTC